MDLNRTLLQLIGDGTLSRPLIAEKIGKSLSYVNSCLQPHTDKEVSAEDTLNIIRYAVSADIEELTSMIETPNRRISNVSVDRRLLNGTARDEVNNIMKMLTIISDAEQDGYKSKEIKSSASRIINQALRIIMEASGGNPDQVNRRQHKMFSATSNGVSV